MEAKLFNVQHEREACKAIVIVVRRNCRLVARSFFLYSSGSCHDVSWLAAEYSETFIYVHALKWMHSQIHTQHRQNDMFSTQHSLGFVATWKFNTLRTQIPCSILFRSMSSPLRGHYLWTSNARRFVRHSSLKIYIQISCAWDEGHNLPHCTHKHIHE